MINRIIENYIKNMKKSDITTFAKKNNISLEDNELNIIYETIKKDWYTIIYGNYNEIFEEIKNKINEKNYKKIEELFFYFKNKYQKFL